MLVCDNLKTRGLRNNIFNPKLKVMGVACGPHEAKGSVIVVDFAAKELAPGEMPSITVQNTNMTLEEQRKCLKESGYKGVIKEPVKKKTTKYSTKEEMKTDGTGSNMVSFSQFITLFQTIGNF